jgi:hypothetical protein
LMDWNRRFSRASRSLSSCRRWYLRFLKVSNAAYTKYSIKCHYKVIIKCENYQDYSVSCNTQISCILSIDIYCTKNHTQHHAYNQFQHFTISTTGIWYIYK